MRDQLTSSIGKKLVVAGTGILLLGFVVAHLAGNLLIFQGPEALNAYASKLRALGPLLLAARAFLIVITVLHIWTSILLARENRRARPIPYQHARPTRSTVAARTMVLSGIMIAAFIVYHLLHFTVRVTHPEISHLTDALGRHDVYSMMVLSFQQPVVSIAYVVAMLLLAMHLSHGMGSLFQTLGLNEDGVDARLAWCSRGVAALLMAGYISIPVAVWLGVIGVPGAIS